jgi:hypothetical protein
MKAVHGVCHAIRTRRAGRYCLGMGLGWLLAALLLALTDAWMGANWLNSNAPGFIVVGLAWLLIALILIWRDR